MAPSPAHPSAGPRVAHAATHAMRVRHDGREERIVVACATAERAAELEQHAAAWLGPTEAAYVGTLKYAKRRQEFLLGRMAAKSALVTWLGGGELGDFDLVAGAFQQPVVHGPAAEPVGVTLAHSGPLAIALAHEQGHPLGIDLERHDPARLEVVRTQVGAAELPRERGPLAESAVWFLLWSAKEALSKALRCGLTCPFELLAIRDARVDAAGVCTGVFANFGQYQFAGWMLGDYGVALVGSRNADFAPEMPALREFALNCARNVTGAAC